MSLSTKKKKKNETAYLSNDDTDISYNLNSGGENDFTYEKYKEMKEKGQIKFDTDIVQGYFSEAQNLFSDVDNNSANPSYGWAINAGKAYSDTINNLSDNEKYVELYLNSIKDSDTNTYDSLSKQFEQYKTALSQTKDYINNLSGFASQYDNEDEYNKGIFEIQAREKVKGKSYDELMAASRNTDNKYVSNWLKDYANENVSLEEITGKRDKALKRQDEVNAQIKKYMDLERAADLPSDKQRYAALLDPLYAEADELTKEIKQNGYDDLIKQKQAEADSKKYAEKYKGLDFNQLLSKISDKNTDGENEWLEKQADSVASSEQLRAKTAELTAEVKHINNELGSGAFEGEEYTEKENQFKRASNALEKYKDLQIIKQREEKAAEYEKLANSPDFAELSKGEWNHIGANDKMTYMTSVEQGIYNYLRNSGKEDEADEYINLIDRRLNERYTQANKEWAENYATEHPWLASAMSLGSNLISGAGIVEDIGKRMAGEPIDVNSPMHYGANLTNALRSTVSDKYLGDVGVFGYDTVMSAADSAVNMAVASAIGGAVGAVAGTAGSAAASAIAQKATSTTMSLVMGSQVATNTVIDAKERGLTDDQAVTLGVLYGIAETISEKYSIEKWMKDPVSVGSVLKKSFIAEGTEEVVANWLDRAADCLVSGDKSEINQKYKDYINQGFSDKEALTMTLFGMVGEDTTSFLAGGISGLAMSGAHMAVAGGVNEVQSAKAEHKSVKELLKPENKDALNELIKAGKEFDKDSDNYKLSERLEKASADGEKISTKDVKKLRRAVVQQAYKDTAEDIKKLYSVTEGFDDEERAAVGYLGGKLRRGQSLTNQENAMIRNDSKILRAVSSFIEKDENDVIDMLDAAKFKDNFKYYSSNGNGLLEVDGNEFRGTVEIKSTNPANGRLTLNLIDDNGNSRTISSDDVDFKNDTEAKLYSIAANFSNPNEANAFVENYEGGDLTDYLTEWNLFSNYGRLGYNRDQIYQRSQLDTDTKVRQAAYYSGMEAFKSFAQVQYLNKQAYEAAAQSFKGYQRGTFVSNVSSERLNKMSRAQRNSIRELKMFTFAGLNVELFESKADKHGNYQGENGSFDAKTKTLRVDINAGFENNSRAVEEATRAYIRLTAAHELTHAAEQGGGYMKLRAEIVRTLEAAGFDYKKLVDKKFNQLSSQDKYKGIAKDKLYRLADEETIADCCETLLNDSKVFEKLFNADKTLAEKFINAVKRAIEKLRQFFKENPTYARTEYGKALQEAMSKVENRVQELWDEAVAQGIRAENNISNNSEKINTPNEKSSDRFDTDYLSAVERGDMATAQQMVDEAAKAAGYDMHLYHGAKSGGGFTVFKDWQYFTKNKPYAERYTQRETGKGLYDVFVKSSRMFDTRNADDRAIFEQYRNEYGMSELTDNGLPDWTDGYDLSEIIEENNLDYDGIILNEGGDLVNGKPVSRGASFVIRKSSQIKSADPVTYDDNGNVIPLSERFNEAKEDIRYSDRVIEENRDLVAVHNLSQEKLLKSLKLGGFPMPSIAVTKSDLPHTEYGEISLIFGKDTISPDANRNNKVYSGDAWTPKYPQIDYEVNYKAAQQLYYRANQVASEPIEFFNPTALYPQNIDDSLNRSGGTEGLIDNYSRDYGFKNFYLKEKTGKSVELRQKEERHKFTDGEVEEFDFLYQRIGDVIDKVKGMNGRQWVKEYREEYEKALAEYWKTVFPDLSDDDIKYSYEALSSLEVLRHARDAYSYHNNGAETVRLVDDIEGTHKEIDSKIDQKEYEAWLRDLFKDVEGKSGIRNNVDTYTPRGNRRSFSQLHYAETLENVVKAMKKQRNGDTFFAGAGLWGVAAKSYGTFEAMKADSKQIKELSEDEYKEIKEGFGARFEEIANNIIQNSKALSDNPYTNLDYCFENILDAVRNNKTKSGLMRELRDIYGDVITDSVASDILDLIADVGNMPTRYFEAKPQRAVGFDEVMAAVVPDSASDEVKAALQQAGITIYEYESNNDKSRAEAMQNAIDTEYVDQSGQRYDNLRFQDRYNEYDDLFDMGEDLFEDSSKREVLDELIEKYPDDALYIIKHAAEQTVENILTKTKSVKLDDDAYLYVARKFMREYNISRAANPEEDSYLAATIKNIVARTEVGELSQSEIMNEFINAARDALLLSGTLDDSMKEEREFVLGLIKGKTLLVTDYNESNIRENYGDLTRYRSKLGHGYISLERNANKKIGGTRGVYIDEIISEIKEAYPSLIDEDANEATGFYWLERLLNDKLEPTFKSSVDSTPEIDAVIGGYEIMANLVDQKARQIVQDNKNGQKFAQLGKTAREMAQEQRKAVKEAVSKVKEEERQKAKKDIKEAREKAEARYKAKLEKKEQQFKKKLDEQREKTRELRHDKNMLIIAERQERINSKRKLRNNYERREYIDRIKKLAQDFQRMAAKPGASKNIVPQNFSDGFYEVAIGITEAIKLSDNTAVGERLNTMVQLMRDLAKDKVYGDTFATEFTEVFRDQVNEFAEAIKGKKIDRNLTLEDAEQIYNILRAIKETVRTANKLLAENEGRTIREVGLSIMAEQAALNVGKFRKNIKVIEKYFMTAQRLGLMFNGYNDNAALVKLVDNINRGQRQKDMFFMTANKMFDGYRAEHVKELDNTAKNVRAVKWKDNTGADRTTNMTGMQAMQIVMTWNREVADDKLVHMQKGGLTIADPELLAKGKTRKAIENATRIMGINQNFITAVASSLTEFEKGYIDIAERFFNELAKDAVNETSLKLHHIKIANSRYYVPIKVDKDTLVKEIEGVKSDSSIEAMGMLKAITPQSSNPIYIYGLDSLINGHISDVSNYYGLAVPIRDMNKVLNVRDSQYDENGVVTSANSVKEALKDNWGEQAIKTYESILIDLQNSRFPKGEPNSSEINNLIRTIRANFVTSTLNGNVSVVLKQAASYTTAGAYLSGGSLTVGLKDFAAHNVGPGRLQKLFDEIDSHTAQHYIRRKGLSSNEIADISQNWINKMLSNSKGGRALSTSELAQKAPSGVNPNNWIQEMDCVTTAALWCATKAEVSREFNKAHKEIDTNEYWQAVTDLYDKVIEDTQPMYDPLHRPEVLKVSNELLKSIFMYKTQPLQNAGIIYDALGRVTTDPKNKAAWKTLGKAVASQSSSLFVFSAMSLAVALLLHRTKRYRDENDELTMQSVTGQLFEDMLINGTGVLLPFGGSEVMGSIFDGQDIVQDNVAETVKDFVSSGQNLVDTIKDTFENYQMGYGIDPENIASAFRDFAVLAGQDVFGIPVKNIGKNVDGIINWAKDLTDGDGQILAPENDPKNKQVAGRFARQIESGNTAEAEKILNEYYQKELEKAKADKDIKNPENKAAQKTRDMLVSAYKTEYQKAFLKQDSKQMERIARILIAGKKYMIWDNGKTSLSKKLDDWRKSAKEDLQKK